MKKTYVNIGILPLEFPDGQQVESGERFTRDFDKAAGASERWLKEVGAIAEYVEPSKVTKRASTRTTHTESEPDEAPVEASIVEDADN